MWNLYHVQSPIGSFFGFARSLAEARQHWGERATITLLDYEASVRLILNERVAGRERVFIAV